jgi:hypothetical protein
VIAWQLALEKRGETRKLHLEVGKETESPESSVSQPIEPMPRKRNLRHLGEKGIHTGKSAEEQTLQAVEVGRQKQVSRTGS